MKPRPFQRKKCQSIYTSNPGAISKLIFHLAQLERGIRNLLSAVMIKVLVIGLRRPPLQGSIYVVVVEVCADGLYTLDSFQAPVELAPEARVQLEGSFFSCTEARVLSFAKL